MQRKAENTSKNPNKQLLRVSFVGNARQTKKPLIKGIIRQPARSVATEWQKKKPWQSAGALFYSSLLKQLPHYRDAIQHPSACKRDQEQVCDGNSNAGQCIHC